MDQDDQHRGQVDRAVRRIARNTAIPTAASILNKMLDFGFAIFMLKTLGPTDVGRYAWAVLLVGYFDIMVGFGLGTLLTRDIARNPSAGGSYLGSALLVRCSLWATVTAGAWTIAGPLSSQLSVNEEMGLTLVLLTVGIGVSNLSGLASAFFSARELMEFPAYISVFTTLAKLALGVPALALGFGIVGVASVALIVNTLTVIVFLVLLHRRFGPIRLEVDGRFAGQLVRLSWPLLINSLLALLFFRVDGLILRATWGDTTLGWYSTAYKFIDGLNVIPSSLTLALFPLMSRLAVPADPSTQEPQPRSHPLSRTTEFALRVLLGLAFPVAVGTTYLAEPIVRVFAGAAYLPHTAIALQILIWIAPLSFVNGLFQYVLIALDRQKLITMTFLGAAAFNIAANLLLIPSWGYAGAAAVTIASEALLLGPFWVTTRRALPQLSLARILLPSVAAAIAMATVIASGEALGLNRFAGVFLALVTYGVLFFTFKGVGDSDIALLRRAAGLS